MSTDDNTVSRRSALKALSLGALGAGCKKKSAPPPEITGEICGNHFELGHRLRTGAFPKPSEVVKREVLIVGGGVAGLSAAWRLAHAGVTDVELVELASELGGTARGGHNDVSAYPWGAHYLPIPNKESELCLRLLEDVGLCTGRDAANRPLYDERHLVFEPEDRIFFRGKWYPGLYLEAGATQEDLRQHNDFKNFVAELRSATGKDGKPAFAIPNDLSSTDSKFTQFDSMTMLQFLTSKGWTSERLKWTIDYACRDDYGAGIDQVSAWAALHYYAGRRPQMTAQQEGTRYFTWPEGNAWLINQLAKRTPRVTTGRLVFSITPNDSALAYDPVTDKTIRYQAKHIVAATPIHVTARLIRGRATPFATHAPWLVANLTLNERPAGMEPHWNNVIYDSDSVGYVDAVHQRFGVHAQTVWSWYRPYPTTERQNLLTMPWRSLADVAMNDLKRAYPQLSQWVTHVDIWRWGHGTLIPAPGVITGTPRKLAAQPMGNIRFAHTDLSGLPLFEEAQHRGVLAAEDILESLKVKYSRWS